MVELIGVGLNSEVEVKLGDEIILCVIINSMDVVYSWLYVDFLNEGEVFVCLMEIMFYEVSVFDLVILCSVNDILWVFVDMWWELFVLNIFILNVDGINDCFMIFGGDDVVIIWSLCVYLCDGVLVYD